MAERQTLGRWLLLYLPFLPLHPVTSTTRANAENGTTKRVKPKKLASSSQRPARHLSCQLTPAPRVGQGRILEPACCLPTGQQSHLLGPRMLRQNQLAWQKISATLRSDPPRTPRSNRCKHKFSPFSQKPLTTGGSFVLPWSGGRLKTLLRFAYCGEQTWMGFCSRLQISADAEDACWRVAPDHDVSSSMLHFLLGSWLRPSSIS